MDLSEGLEEVESLFSDAVQIIIALQSSFETSDQTEPSIITVLRFATMNGTVRIFSDEPSADLMAFTHLQSFQ
jgi:hypothetical protein